MRKQTEAPPSTAPAQPSNYDDKLKKLQTQVARLAQRDRDKNKEIEALQLELRAAKIREEALRKRAESAPKHVGRLAPLNETLSRVNPEDLYVDEGPKPGNNARRNSGPNAVNLSNIKAKVSTGATKRPPVKELARMPETPHTTIGITFSQLEACSSAGVVSPSQVEALWGLFASMVPQPSTEQLSQQEYADDTPPDDDDEY
jgi:hypothetical protein